MGHGCESVSEYNRRYLRGMRPDGEGGMTKPANRLKSGRKASRTAFQPGQSGNPSGRPKLTEEEKAQRSELEEACKGKTKAALDTILKLMKAADKDSVRLNAAQFVIERGWGKALQPNEHSGKNGQPIEHRVIADIVSGKAVTRA